MAERRKRVVDWSVRARIVQVGVEGGDDECIHRGVGDVESDGGVGGGGDAGSNQIKEKGTRSTRASKIISSSREK